LLLWVFCFFFPNKNRFCSGYLHQQTGHAVCPGTRRQFYHGETEVTQGQWNQLASPNPSSFKLGDTYPVDSISWNEAMQFISFLNKLEGTKRYRLPTEAEWEYACRAGSTTAFAKGPVTTFSCNEPEPALVDTAWYCYTSGLQGPARDFKPHPVKTRKPNKWGALRHARQCSRIGFGCLPLAKYLEGQGWGDYRYL